MDRILIKDLSLFAYHGVNPEEKRDGQEFLLDIVLKADLSAARRSDALEDTVNYAAVRKTVDRAFRCTSYDLIERAAQAVCDAVLTEHERVREVTVTVKKPHAPMNALFAYVAVEVTESREAKS